MKTLDRYAFLMVILALYPAIVQVVCLRVFLHCLAESFCLAVGEKKGWFSFLMAVLGFVALAGITESLHPVLQENIRGDILKVIAQNSALVKTHNEKLSIDRIFFRLEVFFGH